MKLLSTDQARIRALLERHPFTRNLPDEVLTQLAALGRLCRWEPGQYLLREGQMVEHFFLILSGRVAVQIYQPERGVMVLQTLGRGDAAGWSWVVPPYRATFDIQIQEPTETVCLPAETLRKYIHDDPQVGVQLLKKLLALLASRLQSARLQLLDLYR